MSEIEPLMFSMVRTLDLRLDVTLIGPLVLCKETFSGEIKFETWIGALTVVNLTFGALRTPLEVIGPFVEEIMRRELAVADWEKE